MDQHAGDDLARLYAALLAIEAAEDELEVMGEQIADVATELLQAIAAVVSMRMRIRRLRSPYFRQRMERFHQRGRGRVTRDTSEHT